MHLNEFQGGGGSYKGIPRSSAQADAIIADTEAAHAVLVAAQRTNLVATQNIPYLNDRLAFNHIVRRKKKEVRRTLHSKSS